MESELAKFRRKKQLEQQKSEAVKFIKSTGESATRAICRALLPDWSDDNTNENADKEPGSSNSAETPPQPKNKWLMYAGTGLRFLAWLLVYMGFIKIGFGAVFFTISLLIFIYFNTRRRKKGEVSAYSVFNKDCQSIDGTLKAEHLEKQLLYRSS